MRSLPLLLLAGWLVGQRQLLDLLPPEADVAGHTEGAFGDEFMPLPLPGAGTVHGIAKVGDRCWVLRGSELHCLDWPTKKVTRTRAAPAGLVGLCADARFLYGIAGRDLHVLDPLAGTSMRTLAIAAEWPPGQVFEHAGEVHVAIDRTVLAVDTRTGATREVARITDIAHWLASDGRCIWRGTGEGCLPEWGARPAWDGRRWPYHALQSAALWVDGQLLVALEDVDGRERRVVFGLLAQAGSWETRPTLTITRERTGLEYWLALPNEPARNEDALKAQLKQVVANTAAGVPALDLLPHHGVAVREVCRVWDLAIAAGIRDVRCSGLEAWGRERQRAAKSAPSVPTKK